MLLSYKSIVHIYIVIPVTGSQSGAFSVFVSICFLSVFCFCFLFFYVNVDIKEKRTSTTVDMSDISYIV